MNLPGVIELLAGILAWTGFLLSLPIFGWLVWGVLCRGREFVRSSPESDGGSPEVSTGRLLRRAGKSDDGSVSRTLLFLASATDPRLTFRAAADGRVRRLGTYPR